MLTDDLFDHLEPSAERHHAHPLRGIAIPKDNPKDIVLHLNFCGRRSPFWNALLKLKPMADPIEAGKRAATLFARHGVHGWDNVIDDGKPVPYTAELGAQVFCKLVDRNRSEIVDDALDAARNPDNFTPPAVEAVELGKK